MSTATPGAPSLERSGFYRIDLESADGRKVSGGVQYAVEVIEDRGPEVVDLRPVVVDGFDRDVLLGAVAALEDFVRPAAALPSAAQVRLPGVRSRLGVSTRGFEPSMFITYSLLSVHVLREASMPV